MYRQQAFPGQYFPGHSLLHRRNAAAKIVTAVLYMAALFVADDWLGWGILTGLVLIALLIGRIPWKAMWRGTKIILILAVVTFLLNAFLYPGEALWSAGSFAITKEGLYYGAAYALRLVLLIVSASVLTGTTAPIRLTDGLEKLMQPLKKLRVPVHEIAMMMSIALRFLPTLVDEFDRIRLAQTARGADFSEKGKIRQKLQMLLPILIPLFVSSFRWAEELAEAMEARCYRGGEGRTKWKTQPWQTADTVLTVIGVLILLGAVCDRIW